MLNEIKDTFNNYQKGFWYDIKSKVDQDLTLGWAYFDGYDQYVWSMRINGKAVRVRTASYDELKEISRLEREIKELKSASVADESPLMDRYGNVIGYVRGEKIDNASAIESLQSLLDERHVMRGVVAEALAVAEEKATEPEFTGFVDARWAFFCTHGRYPDENELPDPQINNDAPLDAERLKSDRKAAKAAAKKAAIAERKAA